MRLQRAGQLGAPPLNCGVRRHVNSPSGQPRWVAQTNAALAGWNIGLLSAFLVAIGLVVLFGGGDGLRDRGALVVALVVSVLVGLALAYVAARRCLPWFARRGRFAAITWLAGLAVLTLLSLPAPFGFLVEG
jgi:hypothetical protein